MSPRLFAGLALLTLITTATAVVVALNQPSATPVQYVDEPAFPELREDPDAVAKVTIETPDGAFSLVRQSADRWVAPDRFDYPVAGDQVRELIVGLADMRLVEAKTSRSELYDRLELQDLDAEEAKSRLVRLENADGEVLAEALVGKQRTRLTGRQSSGTYIRRPGEAQTWLASGSASPALGIEEWLDQKVVALRGDSVRRIEVNPVQGEEYTILRNAEGGELRLEGLGSGEEMAPDANLDRLANALSSVRMEDVRPRDDLDWPDERPTARFVTFDGLQVTVRLARIGEEHFATFDPEQTEPAPAAAGDAEPVAGATGASEAAASETAASQASASQTVDEATSGSAAAAEASGDAAADAAASGIAQETASAAEGEDPAPDAETLQARLGSWAYQIPESLFNRLTTARSELVQEKDGTS